MISSLSLEIQGALGSTGERIISTSNPAQKVSCELKCLSIGDLEEISIRGENCKDVRSVCIKEKESTTRHIRKETVFVAKGDTTDTKNSIAFVPKEDDSTE